MSAILIDLPEVISTPRLTLQMPKAGYGKKLHKAICDGYEDYVKWLSWSTNIPSEEMVEVDCRKHHADFILREFIRYLIIEKESGEVIGRCAFPSFQVIWGIPQFGISYFISKSYRGKGYASEAATAMACVAFKVLNAKKVEIFCDAENVASNKVPLKIGFKHEYTARGGWPRFDKELVQLQAYSIYNIEDLTPIKVSW